MTGLFYLVAAVAIVSTVLMLTRLDAVHALLYLVLSLLSVAVILYIIGAPFAAALELIIYAGAIMVLFIFVVMLLNQGDRATALERSWLKPGMWVGPGALAAILLAEFAYALWHGSPRQFTPRATDPKQVGLALFGPYLIGVEVASMLLTAALVGAYHLGSRTSTRPELPKPDHALRSEARNDYFAQSGIAPGDDLVRVGTNRPAGAP